MDNEQKLADILEDLAEGNLYNQEKANQTISNIVDQLKDCTRFEAYMVIKSVYQSIIALWFDGEEPIKETLNKG